MNAEEYAKLAGKKLSVGELNVLSLIFQGYRPKKVADILIIPRKTVDNRLICAYRKLGATNAMQAFGLALEKGFAIPPRRDSEVMSDCQFGPSGPKLTKREQQVLQLVALGLKNSEIAEKLCVEKSTINGYVINILDKLQTNSRVVASLRGMALELIEPPKPSWQH